MKVGVHNSKKKNWINVSSMQKLALFLTEHVLLKGSSQLIPIYIYIYIYIYIVIDEGLPGFIIVSNIISGHDWYDLFKFIKYYKLSTQIAIWPLSRHKIYANEFNKINSRYLQRNLFTKKYFFYKIISKASNFANIMKQQKYTC